MPGYASYGAPLSSGNTLAHPPKEHFSYAHHRRSNVTAMLWSIIVPLAIFAAVNAALSFSLHYEQPVTCWVVVMICLVSTIAVSWLAIQAMRKSMRSRSQTAPTWYIFLAACAIVAFVAGMCLGRQNYWVNTWPRCESESMTSYNDIDPSLVTGKQMMDVGRVRFVKKAHLDLGKAMAFKNNDVYCVAPIVSNKTSKTYDFWAVGLDCCATDFRCGEYANPSAHSGLRLLREDQVGYFKLAVLQAQAAYGIQSLQPLFFYWVQDPLGELRAYEDEAKNFFGLGCFLAFLLQVVAVIVAVVVFRKFDLD